MTGSFTFTSAGTIVAKPNARSRGTRLRISSATSGSVAPAPPGKTNRKVETTTRCGTGSWCANAAVFSTCSCRYTGNTSAASSAGPWIPTSHSTDSTVVMISSAAKLSPSAASGASAVASAPAGESRAANSSANAPRTASAPATAPRAAPKRARPSANAPATASAMTIAVKIPLTPSVRATGARSAGARVRANAASAASASRGSASPNAATATTAIAAGENPSRRARRSDSTTIITADASANALGKNGISARNAAQPGKGRPSSAAASRASSAASATANATGSDSCSARTAGASANRCASGAAARSSRALQFADDGFDSADDGDIVGVDWRHGGVLRLEPDAPVLAVEPLDGRLAVDHGDDDLAVVRVGARLDDDQIAVQDRRVDHRVAFDAQHEAAGPRHPRRRQDELVFEVLGRGDRHAGRDAPDQRERRRLDGRELVLVARRDERARFGRIALEEPAPLERLQVRLHRRRGREPDALADLAHRLRVPALGRERADRREDPLLLLRRRPFGHQSRLENATQWALRRETLAVGSLGRRIDCAHPTTDRRREQTYVRTILTQQDRLATIWWTNERSAQHLGGQPPPCTARRRNRP